MNVSELITALSDRSQDAEVVVNVGGTMVSDITVESGTDDEQVVIGSRAG